MGEPGGVGPDLTLVVWREHERLGVPPFYLLADPDFVAGRLSTAFMERFVVEKKAANGKLAESA